jgi:nucleotide-binding universal stress UspA family protein
MAGGMYERIVVGTDGSNRAAIAVRQAIALAKATGAKLYAVHAVHQGVNAGWSDTVGGQFEIDRLREATARTRQQLSDEAERAGVEVEVHNPSGEPADALISLAESVNADLIVVGNRGMTGAARFVLGSIPNKVSHHSPCSLLIVRTDAPDN